MSSTEVSTSRRGTEASNGRRGCPKPRGVPGEQVEITRAEVLTQQTAKYKEESPRDPLDALDRVRGVC